VVPKDHLFTAIYATGEGREQLDYHFDHFMRAGVISSDPEPLHSLIRFQDGVSAQKIATAIWTYAIENILAPRR